MSDNPKDDDWGMTMPHARLDDEQMKAVQPPVQPKTDAAPSLPPADEWGMTAPNVNIPKDALPVQSSNQSFSDFDQTAPNIDVPREFTQAPKQSAPVQPVDDWGISDDKIKIPK